MLSQRSQIQKTNYCIIPLYDIQKKAKLQGLKKQPGDGDGVDKEIWGCDEIVLDLESGGGDLTK